MRLTSRELDVSEADRSFPWDETIRGSPQGTFFHLSGLLEALKHLTGGSLHRLAIRKGREVVAVCPLFLFRRGPLRAAYSPPLLGAAHHMGPVLLGYEALTPRKQSQLLSDFQRALDDYLDSELRCNYVEMRYPPGILDARPLQWAGYAVNLLHTRLLDLNHDGDFIWKHAGADLRRNVRKCTDQVTSREASAEELRPFVDMVRRRYARVNVPYPMSQTFLSELFQVLGPQHLRLFVAEESGEMKTGILLAMHGRRATIWHGSMRPVNSHLPVNDHLHWSVVSWAQQRGFEEVEIMDADNRRLEEFKAKFNARLAPCLYAEKSRTWARVAERLGRKPPSLF